MLEMLQNIPLQPLGYHLVLAAPLTIVGRSSVQSW